MRKNMLTWMALNWFEPPFFVTESVRVDTLLWGQSYSKAAFCHLTKCETPNNYQNSAEVFLNYWILCHPPIVISAFFPLGMIFALRFGQRTYFMMSKSGSHHHGSSEVFRLFYILVIWNQSFSLSTHCLGRFAKKFAQNPECPH